MDTDKYASYTTLYSEKEAPYIHSFSWAESRALYKLIHNAKASFTHVTNISKIISNLESMASQLKERTATFVYGKGTHYSSDTKIYNDLQDLFLRATGSSAPGSNQSNIYERIRKATGEKQFYIELSTALTPKISATMELTLESLQSKPTPKIMSDFIKLYNSSIDSNMTLDQASNLFMRELLKQYKHLGKSKSNAKARKNFEMFYTLSLRGASKYSLKQFKLENIDNKEFSRALVHDVSTFLLSHGAQFSNGVVSDLDTIIIGVLARYLNVPSSTDKNSDYQQIINYVHAVLQLRKPTFTDICNLVGMGGEQGIGVVMNIVNSINEETLIKADVIGQQSEKEARQVGMKLLKLSPPEQEHLNKQLDKLNLRSSQKESYSDMIWTRNGITARIQSKNVVGQFYAALHTITDDYGATTNNKSVQEMNLNINLTNGRVPLRDFIAKIGQLQNEDLNKLSYILANEIWRSKVGVLERSNVQGSRGAKHVVVKKTNSKMIDTYLSNIMINYLGIMGDLKSEQLSQEFRQYINFSNLFFLIGNRAVLPTYLLVQQLVDIIANKQQQNRSVKASEVKTPINFKKGGQTATKLQQKKLKAIRQSGEPGFMHNGGYKNTSLVNVGKTAGQNVYNNSDIHINLTSLIRRKEENLYLPLYKKLIFK